MISYQEVSDKSYRDYKLYSILPGLIEENPAMQHLNVRYLLWPSSLSFIIHLFLFFRDNEGYYVAFRAVPDFPYKANIKVIVPAGVCPLPKPFSRFF